MRSSPSANATRLPSLETAGGMEYVVAVDSACMPPLALQMLRLVPAVLAHAMTVPKGLA